METTKIVEQIVANIEKVIVGKKQVVEFAVTTLLAGGHLLIEDVPGVGKTTLANALAKTIGCGFTRIQFTPDTLPSDITGVSMYHMQSGKFEYVKGAIMNQIILADEINRTSPKTQASLLEAMEEGQVTVDGKTYELPKPFMVIATQNPVDYLGTYNLPEAQLDRFYMKISVGYPEPSQEKIMVEQFLSGINQSSIHGVTDADMILKLQDEVKKVKVHGDLVEYIIKIVEETRNNNNITLGASPRSTLALTRVAQATAYMNQRDYVIPDDIKKIVGPVLIHRLLMSPDARLNKQTGETVVKTILGKVPVPIL